MSMLGWCIVQTVVLPVATTFFTARITTAAARASKPDVGSSINIIDGLETSSTAMVSLLRCSVDKPLWPGTPTKQSFTLSSSIVSRTSSTNFCSVDIHRIYKVIKCICYLGKKSHGASDKDTIPLLWLNQFLVATATKLSI